LYNQSRFRHFWSKILHFAYPKKERNPMKKFISLRLLILAALAALLLAGCQKQPATEAPAMEEAPAVTETPAQQEISGVQEDEVAESAVTEAPVVEEPAAAVAAQDISQLQPVYFEFDQYTLTPQARETLAANAAILKNIQQPVRVEGNTDERGSDEYNLALGERRARATRDYLISLGVAGDQLSVISYGEERPVDSASNEEAWAKNRRADFVGR